MLSVMFQLPITRTTTSVTMARIRVLLNTYSYIHTHCKHTNNSQNPDPVYAITASCGVNRMVQSRAATRVGFASTIIIHPVPAPS